MALDNAGFADAPGRRVQEDLRHRVATTLLDRIEIVAADAATAFPFSGDRRLEPADSRRIGRALVQLLASSVRDGRADPRDALVADLRRIALERTLRTGQVFAFAYLVERVALDDLALSETIGATTEPWPAVAQLVRRASFDLLAALAERERLQPVAASIVDPLTTTHTRPVLEAALAKEAERAGRFGEPLSLILFDVDNLSGIDAEHGHGVGDRVLERIGIMLRTYFRQQDWVARYSDESFAVLLTRTEPDDAAQLAERVRQTVEQRFELQDHRSDSRIAVTVSVGLLNVHVPAGEMVDADRLVIEAELAARRAKQSGGNRVERIDVLRK